MRGPREPLLRTPCVRATPQTCFRGLLHFLTEPRLDNRHTDAIESEVYTPLFEPAWPVVP